MLHSAIGPSSSTADLYEIAYKSVQIRKGRAALGGATAAGMAAAVASAENKNKQRDKRTYMSVLYVLLYIYVHTVSYENTLKGVFGNTRGRIKLEKNILYDSFLLPFA